MRRSRTPILWSSLALIAACSSTDEVPTTGSVVLKYAGVSDTQDEVTAVLENGTGYPIYFRGNPDPAPGSFAMICNAKAEAIGYTQGWTENMPTVERMEVKPNHRVHLRLLASLPPDFKGRKQSCRLRLTLESGAVLESLKFSP